MSQPDWRVCVDLGTALSKAAAAPVGKADFREVRPLAVGRFADYANPFLVPCAVFVGDERIVFGGTAFEAADPFIEMRREPLLSFKTVLGAPDLNAALALRASRAVDPHAAFARRDLVLLFLAWLLRLVDRAVAADEAVKASGPLAVRYSRPGWNPHQIAASNKTVSRLFDEARAVVEAAGDALDDPRGLAIDQAVALVRAGAAASGPSRVEACVLEAVAAAACHAAAEDPKERSIWLVLDMGAGTSDLAAIELSPKGITEIEDARVTLPVAGDALDRLLLDLFVTRAKKAKTVAQQSNLWRRTLLTVREQKEELFGHGRASIRYEGQIVTVKRSDVEGDKDFKEFRRSLEEAFQRSLDAAAGRADSQGLRTVNVVLAGGGAHLGFLRDMAAKAKPRRAKARVSVRPTTPEWASSGAFGGQLAPVFAQLSIALGGALAPQALLAAETKHVIGDQSLSNA